MITHPNLFIVGTPKAATTTLHDVLANHPEVNMSLIKEPHFYSEIGQNVPSVRSVQSLEEYQSLFVRKGNYKYRGESSVSYMYDCHALLRIKAVSPNAKIIVMLREPVARMFSHWTMDLRDGIQNLGFREAVLSDLKKQEKGFGVSHMYVDCSLYSEQVAFIRKTFGNKNVFIGFFEDLKSNQVNFMRHLACWLEIDDSTERLSITVKSNPASEPRNRFVKSLFHNFKVRKVLKKALPEFSKAHIRDLVLKPAEKHSIALEDYLFFKEYFAQDVKSLRAIVEWDYAKWGF